MDVTERVVPTESVITARPWWSSKSSAKTPHAAKGDHDAGGPGLDGPGMDVPDGRHRAVDGFEAAARGRAQAFFGTMC